MYPHFVDSICISHFTSYLDCNVLPILHIYSSSVSDCCMYLSMYYHRPHRHLLATLQKIHYDPLVARTNSPTESLLTNRGGRSYRPSSVHSSSVPLYRTSWSGFRTPPAAIPGLLMRPGYHPLKNAMRCHPSLL